MISAVSGITIWLLPARFREQGVEMKLESLQYDAVLSYCIDRTLSGYENAIYYGKLCGFLTSDNELTANGKKVANILASQR